MGLLWGCWPCGEPGRSVVSRRRSPGTERALYPAETLHTSNNVCVRTHTQHTHVYKHTHAHIYICRNARTVLKWCQAVSFSLSLLCCVEGVSSVSAVIRTTYDPVNQEITPLTIALCRTSCQGNGLWHAGA